MADTTQQNPFAGLTLEYAGDSGSVTLADAVKGILCGQLDVDQFNALFKGLFANDKAITDELLKLCEALCLKTVTPLPTDAPGKWELPIQWLVEGTDPDIVKSLIAYDSANSEWCKVIQVPTATDTVSGTVTLQQIKNLICYFLPNETPFTPVHVVQRGNTQGDGQIDFSAGAPPDLVDTINIDVTAWPDIKPEHLNGCARVKIRATARATKLSANANNISMFQIFDSSLGQIVLTAPTGGQGTQSDGGLSDTSIPNIPIKLVDGLATFDIITRFPSATAVGVIEAWISDAIITIDGIDPQSV